MDLANTQLFRGLEKSEITTLFDCLNAAERNFRKGETILSEGSITENMGIVLSGMAVISAAISGAIPVFYGMLRPVPYSPKYMPAFRGSRCSLRCLLRRILPYCF